ncbi:MAG TPA: type II toxin-antitoxin system VapC family toxin [Chthoniobacterales bacterium]|nr:type II toxin-antitoxin system VapC family toxin [Chthoniobacterales bacterium]
MEAARFEVDQSRCIAQQGNFAGKAEVALNVFFDSSALAKRYVEEKGSERVQAILSSASTLAVSVICIPEIVSALYRRRRERKLSTEEYQNAKASLLSDIDDATIIGVTQEVIARAVALLEQFSLRGADALHVACASEWSTDLFVSAENRQCAAARAHGLRIEAIRG